MASRGQGSGIPQCADQSEALCGMPDPCHRNAEGTSGNILQGAADGLKDRNAPLGAVGGGMAAVPPWWEANASFCVYAKSGMSRRRGGAAGSAWPLGGKGQAFRNVPTKGRLFAECLTLATAMRREPAVIFLLGIWGCFAVGWELGSAPR